MRRWLLDKVVVSLFLFNAILCQELDEEGGAELPGELPPPEEIEDPKIRDLLTPNGLDPEVSFRCGMFYSPKQEGAKPKAKIFILPKRFKIDGATFAEYDIPGGDSLSCYSLADGEGNDPINSYCYKVFDAFVQNNNMTSPSKVRDPKGYSMGDDLCEYLTKVGVPKAKVPPNKNFPKGIQVGFYYNKCTDKQWYDTKLRMTETVCCKCQGDCGEGDSLKYNPC